MSKLYDDGLLLRPYQPEDYPELYGFWLLTDMAHPERKDDQEVIERTLRQGGALGLLLHPGRSIIGSAWLTQDGRRSFVHHFAIHPDFRGRGLSHRLMDFVVPELKRLGLQVKLEVHHTNAEARKLYEKYGFEELSGYLVYMKR